MTAAVTEEYKRCLKFTAVKQARLLQTRQSSIRAVIWTKRLEKLPKPYNESFLITQPCRGRFKRNNPWSAMLNGLAYLSLLFSYPFCLTSKKNLKNAHKSSTPKYWGEFCLLPSLLSPFAAATNVCGINTVERLHNGYLGDRRKRPLYRGRCYGVVGV